MGWDNLEKHFVRVHTHSPDKIKLICKGCNFNAVHLKDVHKHKTCSISHLNFEERELMNNIPLVKGWIARENNILCPECGFELDITRPISEHIKTHYKLNVMLYFCIHCCMQLNKKVVLRCDQVLSHMQMCHGFCFLPQLFIKHSGGMDRIICPACPEGKGGNKVVVGWDNLERHFRKVHTNSPEMIKLICQGCGSISVHLNDVHKHKTCRLQEFAKKELPSSVLPSHDHKHHSLKLLGSSFVESQCYSPAQGNSAVPDKSNCDSSGKVNIVSRDFDLKRIKSNESEKPSKRRKFGQNTPQTVGRQTI